MSAEVFMRLTPRFSAGYMEIREVQKCVFASFSLGWSWRSGEEKLLWIHFPVPGFGFEGPLAVEGWMWQQEFNPVFGETLHYVHVLFSFPNLESDSLLTDSLSELFCFSSFVWGFVFPDNKLELAERQLCCLKLKRLDRSLRKISLALVCTDPSLNSTCTF